MNSTKRGSIRKAMDFYATPEAAFRPLLPYISEIGGPIWEPAIGDGRLVRWMREAWPGEPAMMFDGDDLNNGRDFLKDESTWNCIVTNPPFSLALEFCQHAIAHATHVFMLLRLNFLASKKRQTFFQNHEPSALFVLSQRPSFTDDGKTDSIDYAWFYWGEAHRGIFHP